MAVVLIASDVKRRVTPGGKLLNQTGVILIKRFLTDHQLMADLLRSATKTPVCCRQGPLKAADLIVLKYLYLFISSVYRIFSMLTQQPRR